MSTSKINTEKLANAIRVHSLIMVHNARASHIGSGLSIADILAVLYGGVMNFNPKDEKCNFRDRFILSKGHACVPLYAALAEVGFFSKSALTTYGKNFSWLMNHASHKVSGVEFSTGSLGHGLPFAVGKSLAAKSKNEKWKTYVLLSDGEIDEGSNWEAFMFAAHHKLSNLVAIIDYNKLQSLGSTENTLGLEPLNDKFKSFGCHVIEVDGHDHIALKQSFKKDSQGLPKVIIAHTLKGKGVSFMEGSVEWHYKNPYDHQLKLALEELGVANA